MSTSNFPVVRSVPPYIYSPSEVDSEDSLQEPSNARVPWVPRLEQSQWAPIVKEQKRQMERACPGARQVTWEEMNGNYNLEGPVEARPTPPKPAPVPAKEKMRVLLMNKWYLPTILRFIQFAFSLVALILAHAILTYEGLKSHEETSATMALIVGAISIVYLLVVHFFEFTSKPIGIRSPMNIVGVLSLDLIFIVFNSANAALAFLSVAYPGDEDEDKGMDHRQLALVCTLLVALIAWVLTFVVSVLRVVNRMSRKLRDIE